MFEFPKILLVDDEPTVCESLKTLLRNENYEIHVAHHGEDAIDYLNSTAFDLVLLDIVMPNMDGFQVMDHIDLRRPETLVIIITGYASMESAIEALRRGAYHYFIKPFERHELLNTVKNALNQKRLLSERERAEEALRKTYGELEKRVDKHTEAFVRTNEKLREEIDERKRFEEALRESEERYRSVYDTAPLAFVVWDTETRVTDWNKKAEEVFGWSKEEAIGRNFFDFLIPEKDRPHVGEVVDSLLKGQLRSQSINNNLTKSGEIITCEWNNSPLHDRDGNIIGAISLGLDITERKSSEQALRDSEERYRTILDAIEEGYYEVDVSGNLLFYNDALCDILGYSRKELMGMNNRDYTDKETAKKVYQIFNSVYTTGVPEKVFGWEIIRKDGSKRHVEISVTLMKDPAGQVAGFRGIVRDVTDRKKMEKALKESEKNYRVLYEGAKRAEEVYHSVLHTSADAIVIYDLEGNPTYLNPAFTKIFGWTLDEVAGERIPFLPETEREATMAGVAQIIEKGRPIQGFETKRFTKDGCVLDVNISGSRFDDHEGNPAGMLVVLRDTSERKRLEAQLQAAQRMEAIGTLAGGIAHDFNNLLMGIAGNISLIMLDTDSDHYQYERLESMEQYVQSGANLSRQLLGLARGGKYDTKTTDLNEIVKKSAEMFGRTKKEVAIYPKYQEDIWTVEVDRGQIEQVLMNLYVNAWQAMPGGGDLYIQTQNVVLDDSDTGPYSLDSGRYVKISVTDTGAGMDRKTQEKIFDPFFTTKEMGRGTGLGLASVYGIVSNHGGIINIYSEKGHGSTFNIYLPASEKETRKPEETSKEIMRGHETVLLVDDEDVMITVGREMIQELGYNVLIARNGKEAIGIYKKAADTIDLIILDMIMPQMGGGETFDEIKQLNPEVKVLLSSGYSMDGRAGDILKRGCNGFIQKPFNMVDLSHTLRKILDRI